MSAGVVVGPARTSPCHGGRATPTGRPNLAGPPVDQFADGDAMIKRIKVQNFKSLRQVDIPLGRMNLFIGANASGKSNLLDALRLLQGIGNGFTISEILDGRPRSATTEVWEGIRGGSARARFTDGETGGEISLAASGNLFGVADLGADCPRPKVPWEFGIAFTPHDGRVTWEKLSVINDLYESPSGSGRATAEPVIEVRYYTGRKSRPPHLKFERSRPVLGQFAAGNGKWNKAHAEYAVAVARLLANVQRVDPAPALLRGYSQAHTIRRMGEHGENFAALVRTLCQDASAKDAYLSWLKQLRPAEIDDVGTLSGAVGEPLFMLKEGGQHFPAPVLSDGTLRFAAITAACFQPEMPAITTIEEIENGIHASRLRLLVELLRNRAAAGRTQIMATTHSPIVLAWLKPEEYATTFFCHRDEQTGASQIVPLTQVPHFNEVVRRQPISDLFAEGWLEAAL